ncbi:PAS domain-containing protein [Falsiroseomonas ponticola]|uniref:PAS domain-containing protein n=1 Tax=Falsiroseomonas ponticola TaxID=2786951 RepID=UPI0019328840|nr:PAS domain-containing protein [Roseomonas ponticola]
MTRPAPRLRFAVLLLGLVVAVLVPSLGFGAFAAWQAVQGRQDAAGARLVDTARDLASALDREIDRHLGILRGLAAAEALDGPAPDLPRFEAQARRVVGTFGTSATLLDAVTLRPLLDTAAPPGSAPGGAMPAHAVVRDRRAPAVTDFLPGGAGGHAASIGVPVERDGAVRFVLAVRMEAEAFRRALAAPLGAGPRFASLTDGRGVVVARSDAHHGRRTGQPIPAANRRQLAAAPAGLYRAATFDGVPHVFGFHRLALAEGWTVVAAEPAAGFDAAWRITALTLGAGAGLALLLGCGLAFVIARLVLQPVRRLEAHARVLADGEGPLPVGAAAAMPPARVAELEALRRGFAAVETAIGAREERLRQEAERVALALAAGAIVGTWDWDLVTDRFRLDERFAFYFGLDPARARSGLSLEQVIATVHPDDLPGLRTAIAGAIARGGPYAHPYRVRGRDGVFRWIEANGRVYLGPDGRPLRFPGVLLDIEARRNLEAERDRSAMLLRAFIAAMPGVVYAKDREGRMLVANEGVARLVGKPLDTILGRTDAAFLDDPAQAAAVAANDQRIMDSGVAEQVEEAVTLPDGSPAIWLSTKAPFRDGVGKVVGLIGSSVDITARIQAEARLRESETQLRLASEAGAIGFFSCDMESGATYWSEMMYRLYGLDASLPPPSMLPEGAHLDMVHPEDRAALRDRRLAAMADRALVTFAFEFRIRRGDTGEVRWIASRGEFVRAVDGTVRMIRGGQQDVTARREDADRLRLMVHELNHRVKNTLATVQSIAAQSLRGTDEGVRKGLEARILALAAAHDVLTRDGWAGASIDEVVAGVLAPHGGRDGARFRVQGPPLRLVPRVAVTLSMALHELATNALKYGALSVQSGHVAIGWETVAGDPALFRLRWTERGGPPAAPPERQGFGTRLIERSLAHDLGGTTRIDFAAEGVSCVVEAPLAGVVAPAGVVALPRVGRAG